MNDNFPKLDKKTERYYLAKFSGGRYKLFQFLEKIYKKFIDDKDGRIEFIIKHLTENRPRLILEVGSGVFPMYPFLSSSLQKKCMYYICEINPQKVRYLRKKYPHLKIVQSDALSLPFTDNFFDFVFSKGVFHHIDDNNPEERRNKKINFLRESKRVLKKDGINLLMDFCYAPGRLKDIFWHKLYKIILWESDYNYSNQKEMKDFFKITDHRNIQSYQLDTFKGIYYCVIGKK